MVFKGAALLRISWSPGYVASRYQRVPACWVALTPTLGVAPFAEGCPSHWASRQAGRQAGG